MAQNKNAGGDGEKNKNKLMAGQKKEKKGNLLAGNGGGVSKKDSGAQKPNKKDKKQKLQLQQIKELDQAVKGNNKSTLLQKKQKPNTGTAPAAAGSPTKKQKKANAVAPTIPTPAPMDSDDDNIEDLPPKQGLSREDAVSVFVGNLPVNTKRTKLEAMFGQFGKVFSIRFRKSNGGRFFKSPAKLKIASLIAFIDYATQAEAEASLVLNGTKVGENVLRVNLQKLAKASVATGEGFDGKRTIFVGNLKYSVTDQLLHDTFSCCGDIDYVRALQSERGCNGTAYVCFKDLASVQMALELNNSPLEGREMRVQRYTINKQGSGARTKIKKAGAQKQGKESNAGVLRRLKEKDAKGKPESKKTSQEFAGVKQKVDKNKNKQKKKGGLTGPKLLAKKIAPRPNKITA